MVPGIIFDEEKEALEKLGIDYEVLKTKHTCLGNNIIIDEKNALINPEFSDAELKEIENLMSVKAKKTAIADVHAIGSLFVLNKARKKALVSNEIDLEELKMLQDTFNVEISAGSVNMGSPYVRSGIIANKNGFIIGNTSGGPEITNADESLGFLEDE